MHQAEPYCKKCKIKMLFSHAIIDTDSDFELEFYICPKCYTVACENDKSKLYWSNYEWLYKDEEKEWTKSKKRR